MPTRLYVICLLMAITGCTQDEVNVKSQVEFHPQPQVSDDALAANPDTTRQSTPSEFEQQSTLVTPSTQLPLDDCPVLHSNDADAFSGLKIHLENDQLTDWVFMPLLQLEQRKDLLNKPILVAGYIGHSGKDIVCQRLKSANFSHIQFVSQQEEQYDVDSYQSLSLLESPIPKLVVVSSHEEAELFAQFGSQINIVEREQYTSMLSEAREHPEVTSHCKDVFMTQISFHALNGDGHSATEPVARECSLIVIPNIKQISEEMARQRTANIKRNMPMDKYKCET